MADNLNLGDSCCCGSSINGYRRLTLPNGTQVGIIGLDAVMEELYQENRALDAATIVEMIQRLSKKNYIPQSSYPIYQSLFSEEYRRFCEKKSVILRKENEIMSDQDNNKETKKKGIFGLFKNNKAPINENSCCEMKNIPQEQPAKASSRGGCCNIKIVPKEQTKGNSDKGCCK